MKSSTQVRCFRLWLPLESWCYWSQSAYPFTTSSGIILPLRGKWIRHQKINGQPSPVNQIRPRRIPLRRVQSIPLRNNSQKYKIKPNRMKVKRNNKHPSNRYSHLYLALFINPAQPKKLVHLLPWVQPLHVGTCCHYIFGYCAGDANFLHLCVQRCCVLLLLVPVPHLRFPSPRGENEVRIQGRICSWKSPSIVG